MAASNPNSAEARARASVSIESSAGLEIVGLGRSTTVEDFAAAVGSGLTSDPKRLDCAWLYDERGSQLFEAICELPEYYPARAEREILETHAPDILACAPSDLTLVELGSGSSAKTRILIDELLRQRGRLQYVPIDISRSMLESSSRALLEDHPGLEIHGLAMEYQDGLHQLRRQFQGPRLVLWLGSTVGNLARAEAAVFLHGLRDDLEPGDRFLLGIDLRKDPHLLERAYNDSEGVTARFNLNLLARINRELDGHFDLGTFEHEARYDRELGRIEMHLVSRRAQRVAIDRLDLEVDFAARETIHTENSHKYSQREIDELVTAAGFSLNGQWLDRGERFSRWSRLELGAGLSSETALPYLTADLAAVPLVFKARAEDFRVEELPAYAPSGAGDHVYFEIEKRDLTTHDAIRRVAEALEVAPRAIGYAGLKDARGVTRQVLSLEHADPQRVAALSLERIEVVAVSRHTNKLRRGHLRGNRFVLKLRGEAAAREADVRAVLARLEQAGVPNYFGEQRFGQRGDNWRIGRALLRGEHAEAAAWMAGRPGQDTGAVLRARELFEAGDYKRAARAWPGNFRSAVRLSRAMARHGGDARKALRAVGGEELRFFVSAYQSHLFNRVVGARLASAPAGPALGTLLEGDLAWRHAGGAVFRVEDPAREQPRADALEISPSGPLFGRRMTRPAGEPDRLEQAVLAEEGQTWEDFLRPGPLQWQGARRPLRVPLGEHELSAEEDEHGPFLALDFTLPAGAYATAVLREVAKDR